MISSRLSTVVVLVAAAVLTVVVMIGSAGKQSSSARGEPHGQSGPPRADGVGEVSFPGHELTEYAESNPDARSQPRAGHVVDVIALRFHAQGACEHVPDVMASLSRGDWRASLSVQLGVRREIEVEGKGPLYISVSSPAWKSISRRVDGLSGKLTEVNIALESIALIRGRLESVVSLKPITEYQVAVESRLRLGGGTYQGSFRKVSGRGGTLCVVPYQDGSAHRLTLRAAAFRDLKTDWLPVPSGGAVDLGVLYLEPLDEVGVTIRVHDGDLSGPVANAQVLLSEDALRPSSFVVVGDALLPAVGGPGLGSLQRYRTDERGQLTALVPRGAPAYLAFFKPGFQVAVREIGPLVAEGQVVDVDLHAGGSLHCVLLFDSNFEDQGLVLQAKPSSAGGLFQSALDGFCDSGECAVTFSGVPAGEVELMLMQRQSGALGEHFVLLATESVTMPEEGGVDCLMNCMVRSGAGVGGTVVFPTGMECLDARAFYVSSPRRGRADRSSPVVDGMFRLPMPAPAPALLVGVDAHCGDSWQRVFCLSVLDPGSSYDSVLLNATSSLVRGHVGPPDEHGYEHVVLTPLSGNDLADWRILEVSVYPSPEGEFSVYGLPPGPYVARARVSGKREEFLLVEGEAIDLGFRGQ